MELIPSVNRFCYRLCVIERFTITFFGPLLDFIQWQSSILLGSNITSNFSKMPLAGLLQVLIFNSFRYATIL